LLPVRSVSRGEGGENRCGGDLYQRQDDSEETVRKRLEVFDRATSPITEYYRLRDLVVGISALGSVAEVTERSMSALRGRGLLGTNQQGRPWRRRGAEGRSGRDDLPLLPRL
jgi:hypothetical protein